MITLLMKKSRTKKNKKLFFVKNEEKLTRLYLKVMFHYLQVCLRNLPNYQLTNLVSTLYIV